MNDDLAVTLSILRIIRRWSQSELAEGLPQRTRAFWPTGRYSRLDPQVLGRRHFGRPPGRQVPGKERGPDEDQGGGG